MLCAGSRIAIDSTEQATSEQQRMRSDPPGPFGQQL